MRDGFEKLLDQSPTKERSKLEHDLAEIRLLKDRLAALTTTVEHLLRDNNALRLKIGQPFVVTEHTTRGDAAESSMIAEYDSPVG